MEFKDMSYAFGFMSRKLAELIVARFASNYTPHKTIKDADFDRLS